MNSTTTAKRRFEVGATGLPDVPGMMLVTVEALKHLGGSATVQELDEKVIELEAVTEAEQAFTMPRAENRPRVNYYLAWARTYLRRGNALVNSSRAVWALTATGAAITRLDETRAIYEQVNQEDRKKTRAKRRAATAMKADVPRPTDEDPDEAGDWKSSLLALLGAMPPSAFERLSQRLLREAGFTKVEVRGKSGDGGIDGVGVLRMNLVSFQIYFQCKRWKGSVGAKEIRDFRGALQGRADKGLFITTGHFSNQASDEAVRDGAIAIDLIDGDRLCDLLKDNRLGVETEMRESVLIRPRWFEGI
ncbi:MAG: restriction endonuclease [Acidobacteria bacterium]|nr:restriction endonuclease [Acidobacteriota bacterium]MYE42765.1 restriction endonuclease [Acidobacteriota bacterium]